MADEDRRVLAAVHDDIGFVLNSHPEITGQARAAIKEIRRAIQRHLFATAGPGWPD